VPRPRATTYYFSQAGNDQSGTGSQASPWRSLAKAQATLDAHPQGDLALLFERGGVWREQTGLDTAVPNITIADYGTGDKPTFTAFEPIAPVSDWSPVAGYPSLFQRPESVEITWANEGPELDSPFRHGNSLADLSGHEGSWWWNGGTLYVHPRRTAAGQPGDPRTDGKPYELVRTTGPGVRVSGDGSRLENLRAIGWGMIPGGTNQEHGIDCHAWGADRIVVVGCESFYGATHCMTQYSAQGGVVTFVGCRAGLTAYGYGEEIFNTFAEYGGSETIFEACEASYGSLPNALRPENERGGTGFYGHTMGPPYVLGLTIIHNCTIRDQPAGCAAPSTFSDLTPAATLSEVRCFIVNEVFDGGPGSGAAFAIAPPNAARVNGRYVNLQPPFSTQQTLAGWAQQGWAINCTVDADCSAQAAFFSLYNAHGAASTPRLWHCDLRFRSALGQRILLDLYGASAEGSVCNSILACTGGGTLTPNLGGGLLSANAYTGLYPGAAASDPASVSLDSPPAMDERPPCGSPLTCAAGTLPGRVSLAFDRDGRTLPRTAIGPVQSFPCGNCDGSTSTPVLNVRDFTCFLQKFAAADPQANCDGSTASPLLNVRDFICFLQRFAAGCQ
jgi:hypothetical protein